MRHELRGLGQDLRHADGRADAVAFRGHAPSAIDNVPGPRDLIDDALALPPEQVAVEIRAVEQAQHRPGGHADRRQGLPDLVRDRRRELAQRRDPGDVGELVAQDFQGHLPLDVLGDVHEGGEPEAGAGAVRPRDHAEQRLEARAVEPDAVRLLLERGRAGREGPGGVDLGGAEGVEEALRALPDHVRAAAGAEHPHRRLVDVEDDHPVPQAVGHVRTRVEMGGDVGDPGCPERVQGGNPLAGIDDDEADRRDLHADEVPRVVPVGLAGHDDPVVRRRQTDAHVHGSRGRPQCWPAAPPVYGMRKSRFQSRSGTFGGRRPRRRQAPERVSLARGRLRRRRPVSAATALTTAGGTPGRPGSPMPPIGAPLSTIATCTRGIRARSRIG